MKNNVMYAKKGSFESESTAVQGDIYPCIKGEDLDEILISANTRPVHHFTLS